MEPRISAHHRPAWQHGLFAAALVATASVLGGIGTGISISSWYPSLQKPFFNPPNWIFGPVWTVLYIMMGYAAFRILRLPVETPGRAMALMFFCVQMALNAAWPWAFFGAKSTLLGLIVIVPFWFMVTATTWHFYRLDRISGLLLMPYVAWVSFASALNAALWNLNS